MKTGKNVSVIKRNNEGFSLVELVIVMAILAVLTSVTVVGIGAVRNNDLKKMSATFKGTVNNTRTYCLSKKSAYCEFYKDGSGNACCRVVVNGNTISDEKIGGNRLTVKYLIATTKGDYDVDSTGVLEISSVDPLRISFEHSSGALSPQNPADETKSYVYAVFLCKGTDVFQYDFVPVTGKFDLR